MAELNYIAQFRPCIIEMYRRLLISNELYNTNQDIQIINTRGIRLPKIIVPDYRNYNRKTLSFNISSYGNDSETRTLDHDRGIEFATGPTDVDETNQTVSLVNIQSRFEETQTIPESDCYISPELYIETKRAGTEISNTAAITANILSDFGTNIETMEGARVPLERIIMYCTPTFKTKLKNAEGIQHTLEAFGGTKNIGRRVRSSGDISAIKTVSVSRLRTAFDFTGGFQVASAGKQINYIMIDLEAQVPCVKYSYIKVFTPGHDSRIADKYLYQNRCFNGILTLLDDLLKQGCIINAEVEG